jgi:uncharacterized protein (DUF1778 family)
MSENLDVRHVRIEVSREQHRKIRLGAASKGTTMMQFVRDAAVRAAEEEVAKLAAGDTRGAPKKRRRKQPERPIEAV